MQPHNTAQTGQHGPADEVLLSEVRQGKLESFGILYERYVAMARAIAYRHTENSTLSEDLVSEAFVRILQALKNGKGPRNFMGGYLATTIAHLAVENGLIAQKEILSEKYQLESFGSLDETVLKLHESDELISAFTGLPERWQSILWMTEIEEKKPREVASALNLSANAVSALAARARESLREGFLRAHQDAPKTVECSQYSPHLSPMVRGSLSKKRSEALRAHLSICPACSAEYFTLIGINKAMRTWVFPVLAGLAPIITDSSTVLLPYHTGGSFVAAGASHSGFSDLATPGRWGAGNQSLIGAAAVVTAIGAVAGGIALVNNSVPNSAVISADSQLEAAPAPSTPENVGVITDTLVDSLQGSASIMPADSFRPPSAPVPTIPLTPETFDSVVTDESDSDGLSSLSQVNPRDPAGVPHEVVVQAGSIATGAGMGSVGAASNHGASAADAGSSAHNAGLGQSDNFGESGQPISQEKPGAPSPEPQPTSPVKDSVDPQTPADPGTSTAPTAPIATPYPGDPTAPANPVESTAPTSPVTPSYPGDPTSPEPSKPDAPDPLAWVGTPEYYAWMAKVPWDTIGRPVGDNRMCTITYIESDSPVSFGTFIPPVILDSPYAFYVLESHFGLKTITQITCL